MALKFYFKDTEGLYVEVSESPDFSSSIVTTHDGKNGDIKTTLLYIRNDDVLLWYSNIRITAVDTVDAYPYGDVNFSETGWGIKFSKGGVEPTAAEWSDISWGNTLSLDDIGSDSSSDTTTYFPFYYYISSPPNIPAANKTDIQIDVKDTENAVI